MNKHDLIIGTPSPNLSNLSIFAAPILLSAITLADKAGIAADLETLASYMISIAQFLLLKLNLPNNLDLTIEDPNMFILASMYYGDINKWEVIRDANLKGLGGSINLPVMNGSGIELIIPLGS